MLKIKRHFHDDCQLTSIPSITISPVMMSVSVAASTSSTYPVITRETMYGIDASNSRCKSCRVIFVSFATHRHTSAAEYSGAENEDENLAWSCLAR